MDYWHKLIIRRTIRLTPLFFKFRKLIETEFHNDLDLNLEEITSIKTCIREVPFYRNSDSYSNVNIQNLMDLPYLDKTSIMNREHDLISDRLNKKFLLKTTTGGSSGKLLNFYKTYKDVVKEETFADYAFSIIGKNLKIAELRGNKPNKGIYEYKHGRLLLSSYDINKENVIKYIKLIKKYNINCLYVYPSSILLFCKYLNELKDVIELPKIKGILSSSEILNKSDKSFLLDTFGDIKLIDLYGQSEHAAYALSINLGFYRFYKSYSYVEFNDTKKKIDDNRIAEIIGTNIFNQAMPLIRYRTGDLVEIDNSGNIVSIIGRKQDFILNKSRHIVPCILITRDKVLENVLSFQYYQEIAGELIFRAVVNEKFSKFDEDTIVSDLTNRFKGEMDIKLEIVSNIEKTISGKQKKVIVTQQYHFDI